MPTRYNPETRKYDSIDAAGNVLQAGVANTHEAAADFRAPAELQSDPTVRNQELKDLSIKWAGGDQTLGNLFHLGDTDVTDEIFASQTTPVSPFGDEDEEAIRQRTIEEFRRQTEATNAIYDNLLAEARLQGRDRMGQQTAISARSGLIGSDFGAAQRDKVKGFNRDIEGGIQAERLAAIASIENDIRNTAADEIKEKRAAREAGAEAYLDFLRTTADRKSSRFDNIISNLVTQGLDIEDLTPEQFEEIARNLGKDESAVRAAFAQVKAAADAEPYDQFQNTARGIVGIKKGGQVDLLFDSTDIERLGFDEVRDVDGVLVGIRADGTSEVIYGTPKSAGGGASTPQALPTFDEFRISDEAAKLIEAEENRRLQTMIPEERDKYLRSIYDEKKGNQVSPSISKDDLSPTEERSLAQAGFENTRGDVQQFYLNMSPEMQRLWNQGVALGNWSASDITSPQDLEEIQLALEEELGGSGSSLNQNP